MVEGCKKQNSAKSNQGCSKDQSGTFTIILVVGERYSGNAKIITLGDSFLQNLSNDLSNEFPDMKGFSYRNLKSIRQWYLFYSQFDTIGKQAVSQLQNTNGKIISAYYRRNRNGTFKHVNHFQIFVNWKELQGPNND